MVDISGKPETERVAVASGTVFMQQATLDRIQAGEIEKGDVLAVARTAGIMGAKKTPDVIPLCHPILLAAVDVRFATKVSQNDSPAEIQITATVKSLGQTGVEMEAMTAVCISALTVYDMCKAIDPEIYFGQIGLVEKWGGKSGHYIRATQVPLK
jgi:cyclic pyranopterin phosphate synthase